MFIRRTFLIFSVLAVAIGVVPARAAKGGCEAYATGAPGSSGGCSYTASGPGTYSVQTLSGFIISASSDNGAHYHTLVSHSGTPADPTSGVAGDYSGRLATSPGDLVVAAIAIETFRSFAVTIPALFPPPLPAVTSPIQVLGSQTLIFQDGHISAGDA